VSFLAGGPPLLRGAPRVLLGLLALYALWLAFAWFTQRRILFPRHLVAERSPAEDPGDDVERHWLETDGARVEWWFVPALGEVLAGGAPTVVCAHGNAERIDDQRQVWSAFRARGFNVVLCEYRGYGRSSGDPGEDAIVEDFSAVHDLVVARPDVDRERLLYFGRSIGTGVVCELARRRPPRALVLAAPFTSIASMMASYAVPRPFVRDPFDNLSALREVRRPVLLFHGSLDRVVPASCSRRLAKELEDARLALLEGYGHDDIPIMGEHCWTVLEEFLAQTGLR